MKIITAKYCGFCFGVKNAVDIAQKYAASGVYTYGDLIHNEIVISNLNNKGIKSLNTLNEIEFLPQNSKIIIRSHGISKQDYEFIKSKNLKIIDATCPFVKKIHTIVSKYHNLGYHIIILGERTHPEVIGINGWCENSAEIVSDENAAIIPNGYEKLCVVAQTTFSVEKYNNIIKKIDKHQFKTVEIFDTICYTTYRRQSEATEISKKCCKMLILGSRTSSNTGKLLKICEANCSSCYLIENVTELEKINFCPTDTIGIVAGASTPGELITEVKKYMGQQFEEVQSKEFIDGVEESLVSYKEGRRVKGTVILADESGIKVIIGGKKDGLIPKEEVSMSGEYNPSDYPEGSEVEAIITNKQDKESGCVLMSKKRVDQIKEGDKIVETIREGEVFEFLIEKETKGGLLGKLGTYTVFIPASQIKEGFVKDLKVFVGKKLRLTAIEIDDSKHKIVASARKVFEEERKKREEIFWSHVQPNVIVSGKVKRITAFGAFVSVDGFDCLAHIVDLSWSHIKTVDEVLKIGETYDFIVLNVDKEKGRVSLSYKLLQPHPFEKALEKHPIGSVCKGKVISLMPFGAFVEIEKGIEGLVHVSEAAHSFVKNINEVVKVGDIIDVMILNADPANKKITLSIKATTQPPVSEENHPANSEEEKPKINAKKASKEKTENEEALENDWNDDSANTPFADLLKDLDIKK